MHSPVFPLKKHRSNFSELAASLPSNCSLSSFLLNKNITKQTPQEVEQQSTPRLKFYRSIEKTKEHPQVAVSSPESPQPKKTFMNLSTSTVDTRPMQEPVLLQFKEPAVWINKDVNP
jgi:hypothetical protein